MLASEPGVWLLPTLGRVHTNVPRFIAAAKNTDMTTPLALVVDAADYAANNAAYDVLDLPDNWTIHVVRGGSCARASEEALGDLCDGMKWIGWLSDDLIPETPRWDVEVIAALNGWNMVSTDDGTDRGAFNGAAAWSGDLLRAVGTIYPPGLNHYCVDSVWEELGKAMNIWTKLKHVLVRHAHASKTGDVDATAVANQKAWATDEAAFLDWKNDQRLPACERIGELLMAYGVSSAMPDLSDVQVLIATPCGSGKYERLFTKALFGTIEALRQCKATVNFIEMPYCSDIALARTKLFGMFLRSSATHILFIDDDMGWRPQDVVRLISYRRDFVAVAGPRKVFPPSFAVQNSDARGRPAMLYHEASTGLIEVSDVGLAFALLSHDCCKRVAEANPELAFVGDDGREEYAVFNPIVANRRYRSEDFSFCYRWRGVGGKIYVDPAIPLDHVGSFVWSGDWQTQLLAAFRDEQAVA